MRVEDIIEIIESDTWMMEVMHQVASLNLPNWYIGAGFVRSKIWDVLHGYDNRMLLSDIDVLYYDKSDLTTQTEEAITKKINALLPNNTIPLEVRNQARMHVVNNHEGYLSTEDAIAHFPETVTAIAITISKQGNIELYIPFGITDIISMQVKPTPYFNETIERQIYYKNRVMQKNWQEHWPKITIQTEF